MRGDSELRVMVRGEKQMKQRWHVSCPIYAVIPVISLPGILGCYEMTAGHACLSAGSWFLSALAPRPIIVGFCKPKFCSMQVKCLHGSFVSAVSSSDES